MDAQGDREMTEPELFGPCQRCGSQVRVEMIGIPGTYRYHHCHVCGCEWIDRAVKGGE